MTTPDWILAVGIAGVIAADIGIVATLAWLFRHAKGAP